MEIRCKKCNRLLFVENNCIKKLITNNIEYNINGSITVTCKCNYINFFKN